MSPEAHNYIHVFRVYDNLDLDKGPLKLQSQILSWKKKTQRRVSLTDQDRLKLYNFRE